MLASRGLAPVGALLVALSAAPAAAFNPQPRPAPTGGDLVCAEDGTTPCDPDNAGACASATCVVDPADVVPNVEVRGTMTLITDEDVTGWDDGADGSASRPANARYTVMIQYEKDGTLRTFAETYDLEATSCFIFSPCVEENEDPIEFELCVPAGVGWNQPACEKVITDPALNIVYSIPGAQLAKAVAVDLTGNASTTAKPFLAIVDRLPATTSNRSGADPLASVQQLKVTIRLLP
jgi:hypothetical protein